MSRPVPPSGVRVLAASLVLAACLGSAVTADKEPKLPATPKRPVEDTYHGTKVTDEYRWLEDYQPWSISPKSLIEIQLLSEV